MSEDYDPLADLADLAVLCYTNLLRDRYNATRETVGNLVHGLDLDPAAAVDPAAWLAALQQAVTYTEPQVYVVPQGLDVHTAMTFIQDAVPGDVLREAATGTEWVKVTDKDAWLERPGTKGADGVLTYTEVPVTGRRDKKCEPSVFRAVDRRLVRTARHDRRGQGLRAGQRQGLLDRHAIGSHDAGREARGAAHPGACGGNRQRARAVGQAHDPLCAEGEAAVSLDVHDHGLGVWDAVVAETLPDDSTVSLEKRSLKLSAHNLDASPRLVTVQVLDDEGLILAGLWVKPQDIKDMAAEIERRETA